MKNLLALTLLFAVFFSCNSVDSTKKSNDNLIIKLNRKGFQGGSQIPLRFLDTLLTKDFKGIENIDSSFVMAQRLVDKEVLERLLTENKISQALFESVNTHLYYLSGFRKGKQYFVIDKNWNKDFSDDEIIEFDKSVSEKTNRDWKLRDSFPSHNIPFHRLDQDEVFKDTLFLKVFPNKNYFRYANEKEEDKFKHSLQVISLVSNYHEGSFLINNVPYRLKVNTSSLSGRGQSIYFAEKDSSYTYGGNFEYLVSDTVKIEGSYFKFENLSLKEPSLTITPIKDLNKKEGFRIGEYVQNFEIQNLEGEKNSFKSVLGDKELLLIDFWGTWCGPCKELTPEIVNLYSQYKEQVSFMSVACEESIEPIIEYTTKNNMNWYNGWIETNPKKRSSKPNQIISKLRVQCYPTFIVLDKDLNILFSNCGGGSNFEDLKHFIESYEFKTSIQDV